MQLTSPSDACFYEVSVDIAISMGANFTVEKGHLKFHTGSGAIRYILQVHCVYLRGKKVKIRA